MNPKTKDIRATFSGKYAFIPLEWLGSSKDTHYDLRSTRFTGNVLVTCYRDNRRYERVKAFYDHIEGITDPEYKREFDKFLLKRIDNAQSANKEVGCFVFERLPEHITLRGIIKRPRSFTLSKHIPNMIAQIMKAVSILNGVGVAYNRVGIEHLMLSADDKNNIYDVKLLHFDRTTVYKDFRKSMARPELYQNQKVLDLVQQTYLTDVKQTGSFVERLFIGYGNLLIPDNEITDPALLPQVELYREQCKSLKEIGKSMKSAEKPFMMMNFMFGDDYNKIAKSPVKE